MMIEILILGELYTIEYKLTSEDIRLEDCNGYCDYTVKKIIVKDIPMEKHDDNNLKDLLFVRNKILRHEIIHAFLWESGLRDYMNDETLVDWLAIQFPKIQRSINVATEEI